MLQVTGRLSENRRTGEQEGQEDRRTGRQENRRTGEQENRRTGEQEKILGASHVFCSSLLQRLEQALALACRRLTPHASRLTPHRLSAPSTPMPAR
ncbi:MAG: hypothetical protein EI684_16755 [Candidatus Viridilinea halotolerans]|uniref:Uncharacterized protein n=1 Tax=Candidatus Viridilinea halotolerans TaxID=2491704 RepID=A0A426TUN7_9CHLR|nr:MAG: hypothetical protein EI684_16755 [Candidatus Viridilinea halotolerans]